MSGHKVTGLVRQRELLLTLLENYPDVLKAQALEADSAGLAMDRYGIYLDGVEAAQNKMTTSWENLWSKLVSSDAIKWFYDFASSALDSSAAISDKLIPAIIALTTAIIALNSAAIAGNLLTMKASIISAGGALVMLAGNFIETVRMVGIMNASTTMLTASYGALAVTVGVVTVAVGALVAVWYQWNEQITKTQKAGLENTSNAWKDAIDKVAKSGGTATDVLKQYKESIEGVNKAYKEAGPWLQMFVNKQEIIDQGLKETIGYLNESSDNWYGYIKNVKEAAEAAGYLVDEQGRVYQTIEIIGSGPIKRYVGGIQLLSKSELDAAHDMEYLTSKVLYGGMVAETSAKQLEGLAKALKKMSDDSSAISDILAKSATGKLDFEDIQKLIALDSKYIDLLKVENGVIELNADALREINIQKAKDAVDSARKNGATKEEIAILDNYVKQLERSIPISREYSKTFQQMLDATSKQLSSTGSSEAFDEIGKHIFDLNQMVENGTLTSSQYFEQLESQIKDMNLQEVFGKNEGAAQTFFSGLTLNAAQSLSQISSMFDAGQISLTDYMDQMAQLSDVFGVIGDMTLSYADTLGISDEEQAKLSGTVKDSTGEIKSAGEELRESQKLNMLVQDAWRQSTSDTLQFNTEAYNDYMRKIANAAAESGQSFVDMQGNALTSADQIYQYLTASSGNFSLFANQTANNAGKTIQKMVHGAADLLRGLAESIKSFKGGIELTPVATGEVVNFGSTIGAEILNKIGIPSVRLDITGTGGFSSEAIGKAVENFTNNAEKILMNFDANVYTNPDSINQVVDDIGGVTDAYGGLSDAIDNSSDSMKSAGNEAKDQLKGMKDLLDLVVAKIKQEKEEEKDKLKEQLDGYKKIIDQRKQLLKSMKEEKDFQDALADKRKSLSNLQSEILELSLDDSEEARAKRLALEEEAAKQQKEIENDLYDNSIKQQEDALDKSLEGYTDDVNAKIKVIDDYLKQSGQIVQDAIELINQKSDTLFQELMDWNLTYGDGLRETVVNAWDSAYSVLEKYRDALGGINFEHASSQLKGIIDSAGSAISKMGSVVDSANAAAKAVNDALNGSAQFDNSAIAQQELYALRDLNGNGVVGRHSGIDTGFVGGLKSNEEFAKLLDGELVVNKSQMDNFMNKVLPSVMNQPQTSNNSFGGVTFENLLNLTVQGNMDSSVIPDIEKIANYAVDKFNKVLRDQGILRNANAFSR
jgi:hypothetical protein